MSTLTSTRIELGWPTRAGGDVAIQRPVQRHATAHRARHYAYRDARKGRHLGWPGRGEEAGGHLRTRPFCMSIEESETAERGWAELSLDFAVAQHECTPCPTCWPDAEPENPW